VAGSVKIQAQTIRSMIGHLIAFNLRAEPTPIIAVEMLCVVDTGIPRCVAA